MNRCTVWIGVGFVALAGCAAETEGAGGTEAETETETGTGTGSTDGGGDGATTPGGPGSNSMSGDSTMTTATPTTAGSGTADSTAGSTETGGCPPGAEDCPCDIGSTCDGDLVCVDGTCVAELPCVDNGDEPNDTLADATAIPNAICGGMDGTAEGILAPGDLDMYTFSESGVCIGPDPSVDAAADSDVELCVFVDCAGNTPGTATCPADQTESDLDGEPGCCGTNAAALASHSCGIAIMDPTYIIVVGPGADNECLEYALSYRLD